MIRNIYKMLFYFLEKKGIHLMPVHFYSPLLNTNELSKNEKLWNRKAKHIDFRPDAQLFFLNNIVKRYVEECNFPPNATNVPYEYYYKNGAFGSLNAEVYHSMIRHFTPGTIIEVGAGNSTFLAARACLLNRDKRGVASKLISIEPHPKPALKEGFPGLCKLIEKKVEDIDLEFFKTLEENDILFIDSSHTVKAGNDVIFLYLDVLPVLNKGVIVHIHDIFLPYEQPKDRLTNPMSMWNEQYLLESILTYGDKFEIIWSSWFMRMGFLENIKAVIDNFDENSSPSSIWLRKVK